MQKCAFTLAEGAQGITFRFGVEVIARDLEYVESWSSKHQMCAKPLAGPNVFVMTRVLGGTHSYCFCDVGRCREAGLSSGATAGRFEETFQWDGREWNGPSDHSQPKGPAFPPGEYAFVLESGVNDARADSDSMPVMAKLYFTLTP